MNKNGQSGILFIVFIPIFLLILAFVFDNGMMIVENTTFKSTTKTILKDMLENSYTDYETEIKSMYEKNGYDTDMLEVSYENGYLTIYNSNSYNSFFGKIIGINSYRCEVNYTAHLEDGKVIIEEVQNG